MGKEHAKQEELDELFDLLYENPEGVTKAQICEALRIRPRRADVVIHDLRVLFFTEDTINVVCKRVGPRQPPLYSLAGSAAETDPWFLERFGDNDTRLETMEAVCMARVRATDGRTLEGKIALLRARSIARAREDLALWDGS